MQKLVNLKNQKLIADNKKARYNYFIEEEIECGIVLEGSEVKSMRNGRVSILESYANIEQQQLWLINCHVPNYENAKTFNHVERRRRKLLVKKRELLKLIKNNEKFFLLKRIFRIVPLYWILTLGVFALAIFVPDVLNNTTANIVHLIKSLFFIPFDKNGTGHFPILFLGWTLNFEVIFYFLFSLVSLQNC